jgi:hypothetical protein
VSYRLNMRVFHNGKVEYFFKFNIQLIFSTQWKRSLKDRDSSKNMPLVISARLINKNEFNLL